MRTKKKINSILTVTNLFPTPEKRTQGIFNAKRFEALAGLVKVNNRCLVPCWKPWHWPKIRQWRTNQTTPFKTRYWPVFYVPVLGRSFSARLYQKSLQNCADFQIQAEKADLLFVPWLYPDGTALSTLAQRWEKPIWLMAQGSDTFHLQNKDRRRQLLKASEMARGIICVASLLAERLAAAGVAGHKLHIVPNGVDTNRFKVLDRKVVLEELKAQAESQSERPILNFLNRLKDGTKLFLYVGNLNSVKGADLLIEAWAKFVNGSGHAANLQRPHLVVIGKGPLKARLVRTMEKTSAQKHVHFIGTRPHALVVKWMNLADCLCLTSRSEGMPNVILEALACGLPVIATDVGACAQMLKNEPYGCIVASGNVSALTKAFGWGCHLTPDRHSISQRHSAYTWQDQAQRVIDLFNSVENKPFVGPKH